MCVLQLDRLDRKRCEWWSNGRPSINNNAFQPSTVNRIGVKRCASHIDCLTDCSLYADFSDQTITVVDGIRSDLLSSRAILLKYRHGNVTSYFLNCLLNCVQLFGAILIE